MVTAVPMYIQKEETFLFSADVTNWSPYQKYICFYGN